jgi:3-hydroxyacyl-[acyl-carrier-protein] dehydratase
MNSISAQELLSILPHRYPFLMIDKVLDYSKDSILAVKNLSLNEPYIQGHFPENPIMPGVMMIESMAQASTVLAFKFVQDYVSTEDLTKYFKGAGILFVAADQVRFKKVVVPGDQIMIHSHMIRNSRNLFDFESRIEVDGLIVAEAKLKAVGGV